MAAPHLPYWSQDRLLVKNATAQLEPEKGASLVVSAAPQKIALPPTTLDLSPSKREIHERLVCSRGLRANGAWVRLELYILPV
jgi:hypothetical protein